jgi:carbohydrate-selective porin OprB
MKFNFFAVVALLSLLLPFTATYSIENSSPYSGDLLSRSTLTGDWGGLRNDLANKGITFDASVTQIEQGVVSGGKDQQGEYGGRVDFWTWRRRGIGKMALIQIPEP